MDETRSTTFKARQKLVITNPDDNSDSDEGRRPGSMQPFRSTGSSGSRPHLHMDTSQQPYQPTTSLSHRPALSPPSSASSPVESTPPPSTPGKSGPSEPGDCSRQAADRVQGTMNGGGNNRTPRRLLPEVTQPMGPPLRSDKIIIFVTADSEQYYTVNITGCTAPAIREKIFSMLHISDEDQPHYSIYKTEIGAFAIGEALDGDKLWLLCQEQGDATGRLRFLVSHSSASVHEPYTVNTIPPVLPLPTPHQLRQSSRSRHGSVSSASERYLETRSAGYEASVSDDMEPHERDPHRNTIRGPPPRPIVGSLPSQNGFPSPPQLSPLPDFRPSSPAGALSPLRHEPGRRPEKAYGYPPQVYRMPMEDLSRENIRQTNDPNSHTRSSSDTKSERSQATGGAGPQRRPEPTQQPSPLSQDEPERGLFGYRPADVLNSTKPRGIGSVGELPMVNEFVPPRGTGSLPRHSLRPSPSVHRPARPRETRSPMRGGSSQLRVPPAPTIPPPPPPSADAAKSTRSPPNQSQGKKVPYGFFNRAGLPLKSAKSIPDLRSPSFSTHHPPELRPAVPSPGTSKNFDDPALAFTPTPSRPLPQTQARTQPGYNNQSVGSFLSLKEYRSSGIPGETSALPRPKAGQSTVVKPSSSHEYSQISPTYGSASYLGRAPATGSTRPPFIVKPDPISRDYANMARSPPPSPVSPHTFRPPNRAPTQDYSSPSALTAAPSRTPTTDDGESTLRPAEKAHIQRLLDAQSPSGTIMARQLPPVPLPDRRPSITEPQFTHHFSPATREDSSDDDSDEGAEGTIWKDEGLKARDRVQIETTNNATARPPASPKRSDHSNYGVGDQPFDGKDAFMRPPPELVYDRLDEYFKEHNLDQPIIEASSGGTSPTSTDLPPLPVIQSPQGDVRFRHKKSIRVVADEHKQRIRRNRDSMATDVKHKRSTKLWGSKLEEVTAGTAHSMFGNMSNAPESPTTAVHKPIFKWVRGELIGKGTYGRVYLALNATTGEMIAVKQVEIPQTASDREDQRQVTVVEALKSESETLKDLDHPYIVQYLGFEETPMFLSIFLEYVPGGSVGSCLRKHGKFGDNVVRSFTAQILEGLEYLHSKNILHRDLKADNILVENTGICKISDFGISKRTDTENAEAFTAMSGTIFWMAPEVVKAGKKGYTSKIDIWSVGCVVLEMWAGRRPWEDEESYAVIFKLYNANCGPPVPDDVTLTPDAEDFRLKCFAINPEERPTASELRTHPYLELPDFWTFSGDFKNS